MRLWACWTLPPPQALAAGDAVLSFLSPADEASLPAAQVVSARRLPPALRAEARAAYLAACARPPAAPGRDGRTLREAVCAGPGTSPWWYHPTSYRDCESDPAFSRIIACLAVRAEAAARGLDAVTLCGAPEEVALALAPALAVEVRSPARRPPGALRWLRALASRAKTGWDILRGLRAAARLRPAAGRSDVLLSGFWDWSVRVEAGGLADRYYKALPAELSARGLSLSWLLWLDSKAAGPLRGRGDARVLQAYLGVGDVLRATLDFRPLRAYLAWRRRPDLRGLYAHAGLDLWPLFEERLLRGFLDGCLPRCELAALAAERACRDAAPRLLVSFLEHHPFARALASGARHGSGAAWAATQHGSYCAEKTFCFLDPELDFQGRPDGRAAPTPDLLLTMGELGRRCFLSSGYPDGRVVTTGGPRFDHLRMPAAPSPSAAAGRAPRVLAVSTLDTAADIDMVEALVLAADGGRGAEVRVRDHPFSRLADQPRFAALAGAVRLCEGSLEDDLAWAYLVVYTYSTVAEEAVLAGKPVWQWLPLGYNASALAEVSPPPQFAAAAELRTALAAFRADPAHWAPNEARRKSVLDALFFRADGQGALRAAEALGALLASRPDSK
ncbi:MAG: hypothetical protein HY928_13515 [Elusimicrobia bacterium]|nr:hypothetical protein [Elusimicrobiota bacterium]